MVTHACVLLAFRREKKTKTHTIEGALRMLQTYATPRTLPLVVFFGKSGPPA